MALTIGSTLPPTNLYAITDLGEIPPVNSTEETPTLAQIQTQIAETLNQTLFSPSTETNTDSLLYTRQGILGSLLAQSNTFASNPLLNANSLLNPLQENPLSGSDNTDPLLANIQPNLFGLQSNSNDSLFNGLNLNVRLALLSAAYGLPAIPTTTRSTDNSNTSVDTAA